MIELGMPQFYFHNKPKSKPNPEMKCGTLASLCKSKGIRYIDAKGESAIEKARDCASKYGYINSKILQNEYNISQTTLHQFGGAVALSKLIDVPYRNALRYDPGDLLNAAKQYYQEHGDAMRMVDFIRDTGYSTCAIQTAFGSYNEMLKRADIPLFMHKTYTPDEIIADVRKIAEEYGTYSSTIYRKYGEYSQIIIDKTFGSWEALLDIIGEPHVRCRYGKDKMLSDISRVYDKYGCLSKALIGENCDFTYEAASFIFGGRSGIAAAIGHNDAFQVNDSYGQIALRKILDELIGHENFREQETFDWLINPDTGKKLYMDFYIPSSNTCIEYQGEQHFRYSPHFYNNDIRVFWDYVRRDQVKYQLCQLTGMKLIYFSYDETLTQDLVASRIL